MHYVYTVFGADASRALMENEYKKCIECLKKDNGWFESEKFKTKMEADAYTKGLDGGSSGDWSLVMPEQMGPFVLMALVNGFKTKPM